MEWDGSARSFAQRVSSPRKFTKPRRRISTASLAPGASITCTASHTITQGDLDAGSVVNVASATNGVITSPTETETVTAVQSPALSIVKTAASATYDSVGDVISYSYLVTNSGNVTLAGPITVSDARATDEACPVTASLAPGASITCTASHTITQGDLDAGSVVNVASATNGVVTSPTDTETVTATQLPGIQVVKEVSPDGGTNWYDANSAPGPSVPAGTDPQFRFTVTELIGFLGLNGSNPKAISPKGLSYKISTPCSMRYALCVQLSVSDFKTARKAL